jgi:hypothetical protein
MTGASTVAMSVANLTNVQFTVPVSFFIFSKILNNFKRSKQQFLVICRLRHV